MEGRAWSFIIKSRGGGVWIVERLSRCSKEGMVLPARKYACLPKKDAELLKVQLLSQVEEEHTVEQERWKLYCLLIYEYDLISQHVERSSF